jgi:hypothetical protein
MQNCNHSEGKELPRNVPQEAMSSVQAHWTAGTDADADRFSQNKRAQAGPQVSFVVLVVEDASRLEGNEYFATSTRTISLIGSQHILHNQHTLFPSVRQPQLFVAFALPVNSWSNRASFRRSVVSIVSLASISRSTDTHSLTHSLVSQSVSQSVTSQSVSH